MLNVGTLISLLEAYPPTMPVYTLKSCMCCIDLEELEEHHMQLWERGDRRQNIYDRKGTKKNLPACVVISGDLAG